MRTITIGDGYSVVSTDGRTPIPKFTLMPSNPTTAQLLAWAVLEGEPCGRELVDCLIENGVVDVDSEAMRAAWDRGANAGRKWIVEILEEYRRESFGCSFETILEVIRRTEVPK